MSGAAIEYIHGLSVVKSFGQEGASSQRFFEACRANKDIRIKNEFGFVPWNCLHLISLKAAAVGLVFTAGWQTMNGALGLPVLLLAAMFSFTSFGSVESINDAAHILSVTDSVLDRLEELEHTLQQLVDVEQKKSAAISAREQEALNASMKREQAFSMTLKGFEQKRARLLAALGLEDVALRVLASRCAPELREAARLMSELRINQFRILSSAQEPSRILMESRLRLIEDELQRRGLEEEGPSTASRTGSDTHTDLRV